MLFFTETSNWFPRKRQAGALLLKQQGAEWGAHSQPDGLVPHGVRATRWRVSAVTLGALSPAGGPGSPCEEVSPEPRAKCCCGERCTTSRARPTALEASLCCRCGSWTLWHLTSKLVGNYAVVSQKCWAASHHNAGAGEPWLSYPCHT